MTEQLKPCPCGGKAYVRNGEDEDGIYWSWVECQKCGLRTRGKWVSHRSNTCPMHYEEVREQWNVLFPRPALPPAVDREAIAEIMRDIAELPDRTSFEDHPELLLVSENELETILARHLQAIAPAPVWRDPTDEAVFTMVQEIRQQTEGEWEPSIPASYRIAEALLKAMPSHPEHPAVQPKEDAIEEAAALLEEFRDYAATFAPGGAHTNPIWAKVADFLEIHGPFDDETPPAVQPGQGVREALTGILKHREGIMSDIQSAHSNRGNGASEWMREDDRDFRAGLRKAFDDAETALRALTEESQT
ncbi:MAG: hypothetical protein AAFX90_10260 [Pseudomonadota bacterium]